eukprot:CFRG5966T1
MNKISFEGILLNSDVNGRRKSCMDSSNIRSSLYPQTASPLARESSNIELNHSSRMVDEVHSKPSPPPTFDSVRNRENHVELSTRNGMKNSIRQARGNCEDYASNSRRNISSSSPFLTRNQQHSQDDHKLYEEQQYRNVFETRHEQRYEHYSSQSAHNSPTLGGTSVPGSRMESVSISATTSPTFDSSSPSLESGTSTLTPCMGTTSLSTGSGTTGLTPALGTTNLNFTRADQNRQYPVQSPRSSISQRQQKMPCATDGKTVGNGEGISDELDVRADAQKPTNVKKALASGSSAPAAIPGQKATRVRRRRVELERSFPCEHEGCSRLYASSHARHLHYRLKHNSVGVYGEINNSNGTSEKLITNQKEKLLSNESKKQSKRTNKQSLSQMPSQQRQNKSEAPSAAAMHTSFSNAQQYDVDEQFHERDGSESMMAAQHDRGTGYTHQSHRRLSHTRSQLHQQYRGLEYHERTSEHSELQQRFIHSPSNWNTNINSSPQLHCQQKQTINYENGGASQSRASMVHSHIQSPTLPGTRDSTLTPDSAAFHTSNIEASGHRVGRRIDVHSDQYPTKSENGTYSSGIYNRNSIDKWSHMNESRETGGQNNVGTSASSASPSASNKAYVRTSMTNMGRGATMGSNMKDSPSSGFVSRSRGSIEYDLNSGNATGTHYSTQLRRYSADYYSAHPYSCKQPTGHINSGRQLYYPKPQQVHYQQPDQKTTNQRILAYSPSEGYAQYLSDSPQTGSPTISPSLRTQYVSANATMSHSLPTGSGGFRKCSDSPHVQHRFANSVSRTVITSDPQIMEHTFTKDTNEKNGRNVKNLKGSSSRPFDVSNLLL